MRNRNEFSSVLQELRQNNSQPKTSTFFPNVSAEQEAEFAFRLAMSQVQAQQSSSRQNTDTSYKILPIKSMKRPPSNPISVQSQENKRSNFEIKTEPFEMLNESFGFTQVFQDRQHSPLLENESASNHMEFIPYDNSSQSASEMTNQETNQDDMRESTPSSSAQREPNRRFDLTYLAKSVQFLEAKINELLSDEKSENIEIIDKLQRMADIVISVLKQAYELDAPAGKLIRNRIKYFLMLNQQTNLLDFCEIQPIILELIDKMRLWKQQESETIL
uniref:Uncharacterized protein n=1 Tax=Acrobeloides nanus TaxID=290746 RepID=A0A914CBW8_9BILA